MRLLSVLLSVLVFISVSSAQEVAPKAPPEPSDMKPLFNGTDLTGWEGDEKLWTVSNGVIRGQTTKENPAKGNTFLIWRGGTLGDFELRLSFRIKNGNSGIQYRSKQVDTKNSPNKWVVAGYQAEIENTPGKVGFLYHEKGPGRGYPDKGNYLCRVGDKTEIGEDGKAKSVGTLGDNAAIGKLYKKSDETHFEWNDYVIIAKGNRLQHFINGVQTVDVTDNDQKNRMMEGVLALQLHAGPPMLVEFKDVRLKQY
jgi:hypothetical protein